MKPRKLKWDPRHPLADIRGNVYEHRWILFSKIGPGVHSCHWCGAEVRWASQTGAKAGLLQADHVNGDKYDNSPSNLVASCHLCNTRRGNPILVGDHELFVIQPGGTRGRAVEVTCLYCQQSFVARLAKVKTGSVKFCSRKCMNDSRRIRRV